MPEMTRHLREGYISTRTAAKILGCGTNAVRSMVTAGRIKASQSGKRKHMQVLLAEVQGVADELDAAVLKRRTVAVAVARDVAERPKRPLGWDDKFAPRSLEELNQRVRQASPVSGQRAAGIAPPTTKGMIAKRLDRIEAKLDQLLAMWEGE